MRFRSPLLFILIASYYLACQPQNQPTSEESSELVAETESATVEETNKPTILFFGNSLTAGYGLDPSEAFSSIIQKRLDSLNLDYQVVNAGLSGETTASGNTRLNWVLEQQPIDIFVLELGANDGLRGISTEETQRNLNAMIDKVQETYPEAEIILSGMLVPPNMGAGYAADFQKIFPKVADNQEVALIPFLLEDVAGEPELNLPDGIHPTAKGHQIVANTVWEVLYPLLEVAS
ncbi:MAG: arylesterase [Tunicatimonas sp.]|uniref:arylesterase n=1 Tax=Tunicatimonas sp. TaxID=1940096 RepID=UPI003C75CD89